MKLYHTSNKEIREPEIHAGRSNADFGAGFYLSPDASFAGNWAREKTAGEIIINEFELDPEGLNVKTLTKGEEWFNYIFRNRRSMPDMLAEYDVIIGPVANDTLFETYGIITSGFISAEQALELLSVGPEFTQIVIKTEAALRQLEWTGAHTLDASALEKARADYREISERFDAEFGAKLDAIET